MALAAYALITRDEIRAMTPDIETRDDDTLDSLINQASRLAETVTRRKLKSRDLTVVVDAPRSCVLVLPEYPVNSVSALYVDSSRTWDSGALVTDYVLDADGGVLYRDHGWGSARRSVRVEYNAGFETVPEDLQEAVVELVVWLAPRQISGASGNRIRRTPDGGEMEIEIGIPLHVERILRGYERRV